MKTSITLETVLKKDRAIIITGLFLLCILSWLYIIYLAKQMNPMNMDAFLFAMPMSASWTLTDFTLLFLMWIVMMTAMMIPSVTPLILLFALANRKRKEQQNPFVPTTWLLAGYLLVWTGFSLFATTLQWFLQKISMLNPDMISTNKILSGVILIVAGIFQFTPLKQSCLHFCRTPIDFLHTKWKPGRSGALRMGIDNGLYCLGCCWVLMILLFVTGIMNLLWIALIAGFVLLEKVIHAKWISQVAGVTLIFYGLWILVIHNN